MSRPLPGGRINRKLYQDRQPRCSFCSWSTSAPSVNTNSVSDDWEDVNMTDANSIWYYYVNGLDHQLPENDDPAII